MKGDPKVIETLNAVLANELTAINQYFLHARIADSQGFKAIGKKIYEESIEEMKHAQIIIDRILLLEGLPNLQKLHPLSIGENVPEMLQSDLGLEMRGREDLKKGIQVCFEAVCHGSRDLLEKILVESEDHIDWIESQLEIIKTVGAENYLTQQIGH